MESQKCTICGQLTEFECRDCEEPTCEDCLTPFTIHNQIDYCLCKCCHTGQERERADYFQEQERQEEERLKAKKIAADKRWQKYHSKDQIEKRKLKRIELLKWRQEQQQKSAESMAKIFADIFKHM